MVSAGRRFGGCACGFLPRGRCGHRGRRSSHSVSIKSMQSTSSVPPPASGLGGGMAPAVPAAYAAGYPLPPLRGLWTRGFWDSILSSVSTVDTPASAVRRIACAALPERRIGALDTRRLCGSRALLLDAVRGSFEEMPRARPDLVRSAGSCLSALWLTLAHKSWWIVECGGSTPLWVHAERASPGSRWCARDGVLPRYRSASSDADRSRSSARARSCSGLKWP